MYNYTTLDDLELKYGTAILSDLTGQHLTRNQQPVRLFDQTRHTAERYHCADEQGKPYIHNYQTCKRYYPVEAYCQVHQVDYAAALSDLGKQYSIERPLVNWRAHPRPIQNPITPPRQIDYLPVDLYERSCTRFYQNGLYEYLHFTYGQQAADEAFARYRLGTSRRWQYYGYLSTALPQFDVTKNLRQIKVIPFDAMSGRRIKKEQRAERWNDYRQQYESDEKEKIYFAGKQIARAAGMTDVHLEQCFFGEHLLTDHPAQSVALVEGESTAIVCSIIRPQYIWLATGGKNGARWNNPSTFSVLYDRNVVLWPDNDAYEDWSEKAKLLRTLVRTLKVTDYVTKNALPNMNKADLRDILTHPHYRLAKASSIISGELMPFEISNWYPPEWDTNLIGDSVHVDNKPRVE